MNSRVSPSLNLENLCVVSAVVFLGAIQLTNVVKINSIQREINEVDLLIKRKSEGLPPDDFKIEDPITPEKLQFRQKRDDRRSSRRQGDNAGVLYDVTSYASSLRSLPFHV